MKIIKYFLISCSTSLSISYFIVSLNAYFKKEVFNGEELIEELVIALLIGIAIGFASFILRQSAISYQLSIMIHFFIVVTIVFTASYFGSWLDVYNFKSVSLLFLLIFFIYVGVWLAIYLLQEKEIKKLNATLQKRK